MYLYKIQNDLAFEISKYLITLKSRIAFTTFFPVDNMQAQLKLQQSFNKVFGRSMI